MSARKLRTPFFLLALILIVAIVLIELSAIQASAVAARLPFINGQSPPGFDQALQVFTPEQQKILSDLKREKASEIGQLAQDLAGFGVRSLLFVDANLLFGMLLMSLALIIPWGLGLILPKKVLDKNPPESIHARTQGCLTLIFAIILILFAIVQLGLVLAKLITMAMMLLAFPFGTLAYMIIYGSFPRDSMTIVVSFLFFLKLIFGGLLLLAHQKFLENIWLVITFVLSLIANVIITLLYTIVPGFLVSITDAVAAIVVIIIGIILTLIMGIFSLIAIILALKP